MFHDTFHEAAVTLKFGFVTALDEALGRVRVRLPDLDDLQTFWLPVLMPKTHQDKHWHLPDVGEHVAVLLDARGEAGVVLGAVFSIRDAGIDGGPEVFAIRFGNGDVVRHDRRDGSWLIQCAGPVTVEAGGAVTVKAPSVTLDTPQTVCTGNLTVQGAIAIQGAGGGTSTTIAGDVSVDGSIHATGSIMDAGGNSNHHSH